MKKNILVIGGCRSGKSSHALSIANQMSAKNKLFIATSVPRDEEMKNRVKTHRLERGMDWKTAEVPVEVPAAIQKTALTSDVILVDCLTLWVSNLMMNQFGEEEIRGITQALAESMVLAPCPVILVTNEVGAGIVPENKLSRQFRDYAGMVNQIIAAAADKVIWSVAGIPVTIKPGLS